MESRKLVAPCSLDKVSLEETKRHPPGCLLPLVPSCSGSSTKKSSGDASPLSPLLADIDTHSLLCKTRSGSSSTSTESSARDEKLLDASDDPELVSDYLRRLTLLNVLQKEGHLSCEELSTRKSAIIDEMTQSSYGSTASRTRRLSTMDASSVLAHTPSVCGCHPQYQQLPALHSLGGSPLMAQSLVWSVFEADTMTSETTESTATARRRDRRKARKSARRSGKRGAKRSKRTGARKLKSKSTRRRHYSSGSSAAAAAARRRVHCSEAFEDTKCGCHLCVCARKDLWLTTSHSHADGFSLSHSPYLGAVYRGLYHEHDCHGRLQHVGGGRVAHARGGVAQHRGPGGGRRMRYAPSFPKPKPHPMPTEEMWKSICSEKAVRHSYDYVRNEWRRSEIRVKIDTQPFGSGGLREVFYLYNLSDDLETEQLICDKPTAAAQCLDIPLSPLRRRTRSLATGIGIDTVNGSAELRRRYTTDETRDTVESSGRLSATAGDSHSTIEEATETAVVGEGEADVCLRHCCFLDGCKLAEGSSPECFEATAASSKSGDGCLSLLPPMSAMRRATSSPSVTSEQHCGATAALRSGFMHMPSLMPLSPTHSTMTRTSLPSTIKEDECEEPIICGIFDTMTKKSGKEKEECSDESEEATTVEESDDCDEDFEAEEPGLVHCSIPLRPILKCSKSQGIILQPSTKRPFLGRSESHGYFFQANDCCSHCERCVDVVGGAERCQEPEIRASLEKLRRSEEPVVLKPRLWVAKRSKDWRDNSCGSGRIYFNDVCMQATARHYAQVHANSFNSYGPPKSARFLEAFVLELVQREGAPICHVERYIAGDYVKHNNNSGWVNFAKERNTPQAFAHFTYEISKHELLVCDIQGVRDIYTDPQVHTRQRARHFGRGNRYQKGIDDFLRTHRCNQICRYLGLPNVSGNPIDFSGTLAGGQWAEQPLATVAFDAQRTWAMPLLKQPPSRHPSFFESTRCWCVVL